MSVRINVTATDIKEATQGNGSSCMVWRAVTRNLQLESETGSTPVAVHVGYDSIEFGDGDEGLSVTLPIEVGLKIRAWDAKKSSVTPFEFDLDLPDDWREQVQGIAD